MRPIPENLNGPLKKLIAARNELRAAFPKLGFALDGNLIGHIGEAIAITDFKFESLPTGSKSHDFKAFNGTLVQIKTTQKITGSVGLGAIKTSFEHLIVIQIFESGMYKILFDGPGLYIENARSHKPSPSLSVKQLEACNKMVHDAEKLIK